MATEEQTIIQREAPEVEAFKLGLINAAKGLSETAPVGGLPQTQFAGYDPFQDQARTRATSALGSFAPFLTQAFAGNQQASGMLQDEVASLYRDSLIDYDEVVRSNLLQNAGNSVLAGVGSAAGNRGILGAVSAGNTDVDVAQTDFTKIMENARRNIFGTPEEVGSGALGATDKAVQALAGTGFSATDTGVGGIYDPSRGTAVADFFNPYETNVVDRSLADLQRASNIAGLQEDANAAQAGAFGGSRAGIVQSERDRNLLDAQARIAGQLRQQGYGQALQQSQQAFESGQGRQQNLAQLTGQLGIQGGELGLSAEQLASENARQKGILGLQGASQQGQLASEAARLGLSEAELRANVGLQGAQFGLQGAQGLQSVANDIGAQSAQRAALAELQSGLQSNDVNMINQLGGQRFQTEQAQKDAQQQDQLAEVYEPYQRLGFYSDILRGAPTTQMSISQSSTPNPSLLNQIVGGAASGVGIAGAASKIF